jgi:N-sulfoglucosamine sulfohydrolase
VDAGSGLSSATERAIAELYDLEADRYELNNLAADAQYGQIRRELSDRLLIWLKDVNDPILHGPIRTPYYEMAMADLMENER